MLLHEDSGIKGNGWGFISGQLQRTSDGEGLMQGGTL